MLKIHKPLYKKLFFLVITSIGSIGALLGLSALTYTPELSHAETIIYKQTIDDIAYMQEMTPEICQSMELEKQYQLTDSRMNFNGVQPKYWVARLRDGNCWMTQNLDLDIPEKGLSAKDTDIAKDWNNGSTYPSKITQTTASPNFSTENNVIQSWDPAQGGKSTYCKNDKCNITSTISTNDEHDMQGNYYSWGAATAGQAAELVKSDQATQSICPKNWTLPANQASTVGSPILKSYRNLLDNYGWEWNEGNDPNKRSNNISGTISEHNYTINSDPLYFIFGGYVTHNSFSLADRYGYYWSSTAYTDSMAFFLGFYSSTVPSANSYRYSGFSIRCVARTDFSNININVASNLSIELLPETMIEKNETNPSTADLDVKVSSNQPYSVNINAKEHAELISENGDKITSVSGTLDGNSNGWGVMKPGETTYTKITTSPQLFYQATSAEVKDILFKIGISTTPDLPNGEYSTNITITTTQN